jgi:hypothetical protein
MGSIKKQIKSKTEYYVDFTDEECEQLNIKQGDKFTIKNSDDGILLERYGTLELDLSDFDRNLLEFIVSESIKKDITVSELIEQIISDFLKNK